MSILDEIKANIREIADFPKNGILFRDITPVLSNGTLLKKVVELMSEKYVRNRPTKIVGIESRGFILGVAIAYVLGIGFVPVRKKGKLPYETYEASYELEYGQATLEIHRDALMKDDRVVIVDDLLATGGTISATIDLVNKSGAKIIGIEAMIELSALNGREKLNGYNIYTILNY